MPDILQVRNNNTTVRVGVTLLAGELFFDTDTSKLFVGNNATPGGVIVDGALPEAISGATYPIDGADTGKLLIFTHAGTVAVSMAAAGSSGGVYFPAGSKVTLLNLATGNVTITPTTSTINGAATLVLEGGQSAAIYSDGANYWAAVGGSAALGSEIVSRVLIGAAVSLTTATAADVTSITLGVGIWEVSGTVGFTKNTGTLVTELNTAVNTTSATLPTFPSAGTATAQKTGGAGNTANSGIQPAGPCRITVISGTQNVYLVTQATFTVSTMAAYGEIRAVKVG